MAKTFNLKCGYRIECRSEKTRYGFRHLAFLYDNQYNRIGTSKACYYNRTWESFEFQTVIRNVLQGCKWFDAAAVRFIMESILDEATGRIRRNFAMIGAIAKVGDLLCDKPAEKNNWKARMLKAGLPGIEMPENWAGLSEDEKSRRLDNTIAELSK